MTLSQPEAYAITAVVEALVAAAIAPVFGAKRWRAALAAAGGSAITHPIVWYGAYALYLSLGTYTVPLLEAFAVGAEAIGYRALAVRNWRDAFLASLIANAASWGLGVLIQG